MERNLLHSMKQIVHPTFLRFCYFSDFVLLKITYIRQHDCLEYLFRTSDPVLVKLNLSPSFVDVHTGLISKRNSFLVFQFMSRAVASMTSINVLKVSLNIQVQSC